MLIPVVGSAGENKESAKMTTMLKKVDGKDVSFEDIVSAVSSRTDAGNPLVLIGPNRAELSTLLKAIRNRIAMADDGRDVMSTRLEEFRPRYIAAMQKKLLGGFRRKMRNADVLIVEEFEKLERGCMIQEELVALMADYNDVGKQVIVTSEVPLDKIRGCSRTNIRIAALSAAAESYFVSC